MKFFKNSNEKASANCSKRIRIASSLLSFGKLYEAKMPIKYCIVYLTALVNSFFLLIFVQNTGLYSFGISSLTQGFARLIYVLLKIDETQRNIVYNVFYWLFYMFSNIPLIIFSYKKIGKRFTFLAAHYVVASNVFGFIISIIPGASDLPPMLANIKDTDYWTEAINSFGTNKDVLRSATFVPFLWGDRTQGNVIVSIFIYAVLFSIINGVGLSVLYIMGTCAGGADFLTQYYSRKKSRSMGPIFFYVNSFILLISFFIGSFAAGSVVLNDVKGYKNIAWRADLFFSPNLIATFLSVWLSGIIINQLFPRYHFAELKIFTDKIEEIRLALLNDRVSHGLSIQEITGGYTMTKKRMIVSVTMYVEIPNIIKIIRKIDKECLVSISRIRGINGYIYLRHQD